MASGLVQRAQCPRLLKTSSRTTIASMSDTPGQPASQETHFINGLDRIRMIVSCPAERGPHPGLILIPDVRGIYDHFIDVAERFAAAGYVTATLDLYSREGLPEILDVTSALRWLAQLPDQRVLNDIAACRRALAERDDVRADALAITGFCMGGQYALMSACSIDGFAAAVSWYGMLRHAKKTEQKLADPLDTVDALRCPYLGLFGENDDLIPREQVAQLETKLKLLSHETQVVTYADAGHAFFNDARPETYVESAALDAWPRALDFLRRQLG
jgi:carboxymethylenebutenolidase